MARQASCFLDKLLRNAKQASDANVFVDVWPANASAQVDDPPMIPLSLGGSLETRKLDDRHADFSTVGETDAETAVCEPYRNGDRRADPDALSRRSHPSIQEFVAELVNDVANAPQLASILSPGFRDTWSLQPEFRVAAPPLNVNMRWFRAVGGPEPEDVIEVRRSILDEEDGPMLPHGLQGMHGREIFLPRETSLRPDRHRLEERYAAFRQAAG